MAIPITSAITQGIGIAKRVVDIPVRAAQRTINQSINIATGRFTPQLIIKYLVYLAIFCIIIIVGMMLIRSGLVSIDMLGCGLGNTGCDVPVVGGGCTDCSAQLMHSFYLWWELEWILRCVLYIAFAWIMGLIIYVWGVWLSKKLLRVDLYIRKIEDWIFGFKWEGEAEKQLETRL